MGTTPERRTQRSERRDLRTEQTTPPERDQIRSKRARAEPPDLADLEHRYTAVEVERASRYAEQNGARNTLAYVAKTLRDWHGERLEQRESAEPKKLLCDRCELPKWLDDLTVWYGWGLCSDCRKGIDRQAAAGYRLIESMWREDDPTPTAQKVAAHWERVTA